MRCAMSTSISSSLARTYEECLVTRRRTSLPFVLDEVIGGVDDLTRGIADGAMDVINLKISKVGGLTKARLMRDLCIQAGIPMTIEDTWGGDIVTATIAHLAQSTPEEFSFSATDFNSYGTKDIAAGAPKRVDGRHARTERAGARDHAEVRRAGRAGAGDQVRSTRSIEIIALPRRGRGGGCDRGGGCAAAGGDAVGAVALHRARPVAPQFRTQ